MIVLDYARRLTLDIRAARAAFGPLMSELPGLLAHAREERRADRFDAGEGRRVRELVNAARSHLVSTMSQRHIEELAEEFARKTSTFQRVQLNRQTRAALGVDAFARDRFLPVLVEGFVDENVALIKGITPQLADAVEAAVTRALQKGTLHGDLAEELEDRFGYAEDRAKLIARDQIGKLYGQVNAARQQEMGVAKFIWRTVGDSRVRGMPGGKYERAEPSHAALEGETFEYANPPPADVDGGPALPGVPINCRCYPEPVFDDLLADL